MARARASISSTTRAPPPVNDLMSMYGRRISLPVASGVGASSASYFHFRENMRRQGFHTTAARCLTHRRFSGMRGLRANVAVTCQVLAEKVPRADVERRAPLVEIDHDFLACRRA